MNTIKLFSTKRNGVLYDIYLYDNGVVDVNYSDDTQNCTGVYNINSILHTPLFPIHRIFNKEISLSKEGLLLIEKNETIYTNPITEEIIMTIYNSFTNELPVLE